MIAALWASVTRSVGGEESAMGDRSTHSQSTVGGRQDGLQKATGEGVKVRCRSDEANVVE